MREVRSSGIRMALAKPISLAFCWSCCSAHHAVKFHESRFRMNGMISFYIQAFRVLWLPISMKVILERYLLSVLAGRTHLNSALHTDPQQNLRFCLLLKSSDLRYVSKSITTEIEPEELALCR